MRFDYCVLWYGWVFLFVLGLVFFSLLSNCSQVFVVIFVFVSCCYCYTCLVETNAFSQNEMLMTHWSCFVHFVFGAFVH